MVRVFAVSLFLAQSACSGTDSPRDRSSYDSYGANSAIPSIGSGGTGATSGAGGTPANAARDSTAGTAGIAGQPIAVFGPLGVSCSDASPCPGALHCFAAGGTDFPVFSPAGGYCSKLCADDSDCAPVDPNARCVDLFMGDSEAPSPKICAPACVLGDATACGARPDLACWPIDNSSGATAARACLPTCNHDELCPTGTVCDGYVNLCADTAPAGGQPLGSVCNPAADVNVCAEGLCVELEAGGVCSAFCRRGTFPQCGSVAGENAVCGWVFPGDEDAGVADVGMCASTCACDADCVPGTRCVLHADRVGMNDPGICTVGATVAIETCPN
ncbi:MAG TPA: hypothetical protein VKP30_29815 [Polyangiaceae bacterium]|nr:hypothetical protein [Polyangiaceae bacterium]